MKNDKNWQQIWLYLKGVFDRADFRENNKYIYIYIKYKIYIIKKRKKKKKKKERKWGMKTFWEVFD